PLRRGDGHPRRDGSPRARRTGPAAGGALLLDADREGDVRRLRARARGATLEQLMHVGLNLVFLVPDETGGMETAARELIPELAQAAPEVRFTAFVNREAAAARGPWGDVIPSVTVPVRATNRLEWVRGEQLLLPRLARERGVDLVHSLGGTAPAR